MKTKMALLFLIIFFRLQNKWEIIYNDMLLIYWVFVSLKGWDAQNQFIIIIVIIIKHLIKIIL